MVSKLYFRLLPALVLLIVINAVNGLISGLFAGNFIGETALSAVGLYSPVGLFVGAVGTLFLGGAMVLAGKQMGRHQIERMNSIFSLDFYQKEAVGGKITATTYEIFMADVSSVVVSDKKIIIADKTSKNGSERVFRIRLTLKSMDFKKTEIYYLTVMEKGTANIIEKIEFTIDIAFVNDFDF